MVEGYVTAVNRANGGFFLQNSTCCSSCPCSPWSGIYVYYDFSLRTSPSLWLPNAAVGDRLQISAPVGAFGNLTQLSMSATSVVTVLSTNHTVQPIAVTTGAIGLGCGLSGESYESMLVRFTNVQILSEPNSAGEILIDDGSGPTQLEDTLLDTDGHLQALVGGPLTGRVLSSLTGVVYFSGTAGGSFEIFPRTADDVVLAPLPRLFAQLLHAPRPRKLGYRFRILVAHEVHVPGRLHLRALHLELLAMDLVAELVQRLLIRAQRATTAPTFGGSRKRKEGRRVGRSEVRAGLM
jgi:hypothetical protein